MSSTTIGVIALAGLICIGFSVLSMARGRFQYAQDNRGTKYLERSEFPVAFWLITGGFFAAGIVTLAVAAFLYFRS